jgi:hypothetical protein
MADRDFAEYYERYRAHCVRAGVEPLPPEAVQARLGGTDNQPRRSWAHAGTDSVTTCGA